MRLRNRTYSIVRLMAVWLSCVVISGPAVAHHGGVLDWKYDNPVGPVTGVATQFGFRFPHVQIFIDLPDEDGEVRNFLLITRWTPTILRKHGWTRKSIKPGDKITVTYDEHVSNPDAGHIIRLEVNGDLLETNFD